LFISGALSQQDNTCFNHWQKEGGFLRDRLGGFVSIDNEDNVIRIAAIPYCACPQIKAHELNYHLLMSEACCVDCYVFNGKISGSSNPFDIITDIYRLFRGTAREEQKIKSRFGRWLKIYLERHLDHPHIRALIHSQD